MIGDHLFDLQADGSITLGGICESYEQIDDVTIKFVLKEGVKFSDGTDLTSEDILWELSRLKEAPRSASNFAFVNAEESEIVDDRTIIVKFNQAWAPYQNTLSTGRGTIVSKAAFEAMGEADFSRAPVTTGPYKVAEWIPGTSITLTRNEYYWGEPAKTENMSLSSSPKQLPASSSLKPALPTSPTTLKAMTLPALTLWTAIMLSPVMHTVTLL